MSTLKLVFCFNCFFFRVLHWSPPRAIQGVDVRGEACQGQAGFNSKFCKQIGTGSKPKVKTKAKAELRVRSKGGRAVRVSRAPVDVGASASSACEDVRVAGGVCMYVCLHILIDMSISEVISYHPQSLSLSRGFELEAAVPGPGRVGSRPARPWHLVLVLLLPASAAFQSSCDSSRSADWHSIYYIRYSLAGGPQST